VKAVDRYIGLYTGDECAGFAGELFQNYFFILLHLSPLSTTESFEKVDVNIFSVFLRGKLLLPSGFQSLDGK
jgi:hypothetical protein